MSYGTRVVHEYLLLQYSCYVYHSNRGSGILWCVDKSWRARGAIDGQKNIARELYRGEMRRGKNCTASAREKSLRATSVVSSTAALLARIIFYTEGLSTAGGVSIGVVVWYTSAHHLCTAAPNIYIPTCNAHKFPVQCTAYGGGWSRGRLLRTLHPELVHYI